MKAPRYSRILAAGAAAMIVSGGCAQIGLGSSASTQADQTAVGLKAAAKASKASKKAAEKGDREAAVAYAEDAVLAAPDEAAYRARLGYAYQQAGRFVSAEQAFAEARVLGDNSTGTLVGHALALTAIGQTDKARDLLSERRADIPASDYGLALALAGNAKGAIPVLENAVRAAPQSRQTRQNLAFAYALDGRWREAQMMVEQDLTPENQRKRMTEWAQLARVGAHRERVASILGVVPVASDSGMPVMLALESTRTPDLIASADAGAPLRYSGASLAAVGVADDSGFTGARAGKVTFHEADAKLAPAPIAPRAAVAPASVDASARIDPIVEVERPGSLAATAMPSSRPYGEKAPVSAKADFVAPSASAAKPLTATPAQRPTSVSPYVVQLGAYSSQRNSDRAWQLQTKRYPALAGHAPAEAAVTLGGKQIYRVAATGFSSRRSAISLCREVKAQGGECFVRTSEGFSIR